MLSVLRASQRLVRPGGRTASCTIHPTPDSTPADVAGLDRDAPVAVASHLPNPRAACAGGFVDIEVTDCTAEFAIVARSSIDQYDRHHDALSICSPH